VALDEAGGYDLARGFETMIQGDRAIEQAIRDLQISLITALSMRKDSSVDQSRVLAFTQAQGQIQTSMAGAVDLAQRQRGASMAASEISYRAGQSIGSNPGSAQSKTVPAPAAAPSGGSGGSGGGRSGLDASANAAGAQGGSGGGLVEGLVKSIPFASWVLNPIDEFRSQRDKNARYQSIVGGSNWDAISERTSEEAYAWSTRAMFSSEESRKAFYGVTSLGYNEDAGEGVGQGYGRQDALDFIYKGKSARGQSVEEGLTQMDAFARVASGSLDQFSEALTAVGNAAAEAGVNAKMAREMFLASYSQANAAGFGMSSTGWAQQVTTTTNSMGRAYAMNTDTSGMTDQSVLRMQAAMSGVSYTDMVNSQMAGGQVAAKGQASAMKNLLSIFDPQVVAWAKEQVATIDLNDDTAVRELGREMLRRSGLDPEQVKVTAEAFTGRRYTGYEDLMAEIIRTLGGEGFGSKEQTRKAGLIGGEGSDDYKTLGQGQVQTGTTAVGGKGFAVAAPTYENIQSELGTAYNEHIEAGGQEARSGAFEQLMSKLGAENQDEQQVKIGGQTMSMQDILNDPKAYQKLTMGKGKLVGGEFDGERISQVVAQAEEDQEEETTETASGVNVTIGLTDEAKELLTASTDSADASGVPRSDS